MNQQLPNLLVLLLGFVLPFATSCGSDRTAGLHRHEFADGRFSVDFVGKPEITTEQQKVGEYTLQRTEATYLRKTTVYAAQVIQVLPHAEEPMTFGRDSKSARQTGPSPIRTKP